MDTHREVLRVIVAHLEEALRAGAGVLRALQTQQPLTTLYRSGRELECSGPCKHNSHLQHYTAPGGYWSAPGPANTTVTYDTILLRAGAAVLRALLTQQPLTTLYRSGRALECSGPCKHNSHLRHYTAPGGRWSAPGPANTTVTYDTIPLRVGAGVLRALLTQQPLTTLYRSGRALQCSGPC